MIVKIDWISFTLELNEVMENDRDTALAIVSAVDDLHPNLSQWLSLEEPFQAGNGRAPYSVRWSREDHGLMVFANPRLSHALIEITGRGCGRLDSSAVLHDVLKAVSRRLTRLDIACDMLTDTRPTAFVAERQQGRFKSHSEVVSDYGETCYVGARSSDRYARVYRYNAPHERSHLLRCEFVIKKENARLMVDNILNDGLLAVAAALGQTFGWQHYAWEVTEDAAELEVFRPERREGKTLFWLADTIAPLLVRLHREGFLNIDQWLDDHVRTKLQS